MPRSFRLTAWDCLQLLTKRYSDQQVRFVVEFDGRLDESLLAEAIRSAVEAEPVLACRVQERFFHPHWIPVPGLDAATLLRVVPATGTALDDLLIEDLDPRSGPIVRFSLVRGQRDALVVNLDHTAGDASSVRSLAYLVASVYGRPGRAAAADRRASFAKRGFRSLRPLMHVTADDGVVAATPGAEASWRFPWRSGVAEFRKRILIRRLDPGRAEGVRRFAGARNAWLNDVFLAAYFRALGRLVGDVGGAPRLTVPVDLRAYLAARDRPRIANFSASFELALDGSWRGPFEETFASVRAATLRAREGRPGLAQAGTLSTVVDRVPFRILRRRFETGKVRMSLPPPWFIALGVLSPERLSFGSVAPRHAYALPSVGRAGAVFQLSASLCADAMTFAVCFAGDEANHALVGRFLDLYEAELPS